uniref:Annexin A13 n=1 Tax=Anthurium amnicola TaxID=1678845 RepID=A0A1D1Y5F2_9ARAE
MASHVRSSRSPRLESTCKEIHNTWGSLNHLSGALASCTASERKQIREMYKAMYGEDLVERLHGDHSANPENEMSAALYMWMLDPLERDAFVAKKALEYIDSQCRALVEIYTCRKSNQLFYINRAYQTRFKRTLDQDVISQPSHPYQRIMVALAASHKSHNTDVSQHIAKCDAKRLYEAGKGGMGTIDESVILELLSKRSISQLKQAFSCYKQIYGHNYTKSLKKEPSGEFLESLRQVVKCMSDPPKYFSKVLYMSMKGMISDRSAVTRVIVGRAEVDMKEIERTFKKKYGMKLQEAICENVQNKDMQNFLVTLMASSNP